MKEFTSGDLVAIGLDVFPIFLGVYFMWVGVSINIRYPKMDGENNGKHYEQNGMIWGLYTHPYFWGPHPYKAEKKHRFDVSILGKTQRHAGIHL